MCTGRSKIDGKNTLDDFYQNISTKTLYHGSARRGLKVSTINHQTFILWSNKFQLKRVEHDCFGDILGRFFLQIMMPIIELYINIALHLDV